MSIFRVFKTMGDSQENSILIGKVTTPQEWTNLISKPENNNSLVYTLNDKDEEVDKNLVVICKPTTSMESMVGALSSKFKSSRNSK